ncbi:MAG: Ig-like domain-containing protein, partial [Anaerococcus sp.]|nr:Ig-like domain-containing protein [Anaerococcus sp.]
MEKNDILKRIIEEKKLNGSKKKPKYATRKLSMGLVSCMLGYALLFSPSSAQAAGETGEEIVAEDKVEPSSDNQSSNEQPSDDQIVDNAANDNAENNVEENKEVAASADQTDEPEVSEEKEDQTADIEKESDDKLVEDKEDTDKTVEEDKKESLENKDSKDSIEISPEDNKENDRVSAEEHKDISNDIINPRVSIRTENTTTPGTLDAGLGEQLTWGVSFTTPEGTKEGDTFTVKLSDNMSLKGLEPDTDYALPVKFGDKTIATAKRIDRQTIQYTFTKDIEDLKYARVYIINSAQENKNVVQNSGNQTFKINVGEKAKAEEHINVDFGKLYHAETSENVNGRSQFTEFNPETGEFTQVFYLNPESK